VPLLSKYIQRGMHLCLVVSRFPHIQIIWLMWMMATKVNISQP